MNAHSLPMKIILIWTLLGCLLALIYKHMYAKLINEMPNKYAKAFLIIYTVPVWMMIPLMYPIYYFWGKKE